MPLTIDTIDAVEIPWPSSKKNDNFIPKNIDFNKIENTLRERFHPKLHEVEKFQYSSWWKMSLKGNEEILGFYAAILVFLTIVLVFVLNVRRTARLEVCDKDILIENEIEQDVSQTIHV